LVEDKGAVAPVLAAAAAAAAAETEVMVAMGG
jgi:hypothetical protein